MNLLFITLFSFFGMAQGELPKHYNMEDMNLGKIPYSKRLTLKADFQIPQGFKATQYATLDVYEKHPGGWKKLQTLKENKVAGMRLGNIIAFEDVLNLDSKQSEVALDLSVSFCNKICVINNFQGIAKRSRESKKQNIVVKMKGFLPHEKIKKKYQLKEKPTT